MVNSMSSISQNLKGLIWYRKSQFQKYLSYEVPKTWNEMMTQWIQWLQMVKSQSICAENGPASGWLVTD